MAVVDVADLHARALTREAARAQRREAALVGEPGERVGLVHELRQLRGAEELLDRRHDRADVDQGLRRDRLDVLGGHPLADDALHAREADADLVLDQLADRAQAPVAEVVDVVGLDRDRDRVLALADRHRGVACVQPDEVLDGGGDVLLGERADGRVDGEAELLVGLVAADLGQVVALVLEEEVLQQGLRALLGGRLARAQLAVDVEQGLVLARGVVLLERGEHASRRTPKRCWMRSLSQPSALSSTVTGWRRLRSMRTPTVSRLSTSNSSHAPRDGMILTEKTSLSVDLSIAVSK